VILPVIWITLENISRLDIASSFKETILWVSEETNMRGQLNHCKNGLFGQGVAHKSELEAQWFQNNPPVPMVAAPTPAPASRPQGQIKIRDGSLQVGDLISGRVITGFGKTWTKIIRDDETSIWGLAPGQDYRINMQYAYFN
jgi:hypothetical protein